MSTKINNKKMFFTIIVLCGIFNVSELLAPDASMSPATGSQAEVDENFYYLDVGILAMLNGKEYYPRLVCGNKQYNLYTKANLFNPSEPSEDIFKAGQIFKIAHQSNHNPKSWVTMRFYYDGKERRGKAEVYKVHLESMHLTVPDSQENLVNAFQYAIQIYAWVLRQDNTVNYEEEMEQFKRDLLNKATQGVTVDDQKEMIKKALETAIHNTADSPQAPEAAPVSTAHPEESPAIEVVTKTRNLISYSKNGVEITINIPDDDTSPLTLGLFSCDQGQNHAQHLAEALADLMLSLRNYSPDRLVTLMSELFNKISELGSFESPQVRGEFRIAFSLELNVLDRQSRKTYLPDIIKLARDNLKRLFGMVKTEVARIDAKTSAA